MKFAALSPIIVSLLFASSQGSDCEECKDVVGKLIQLVKDEKSGKTSLATFVCVNQENCDSKMQRYIDLLKKVIGVLNVEAEQVCDKLQLCHVNKVDLQQKFILSMIKVTHSFVTLLKDSEYDWYNCTSNCAHLWGPMSGFFEKNKNALQLESSRLCNLDFVTTFVNPSDCQIKLNNIVDQMGSLTYSCRLVCGEVKFEKMFNEEKLKELENFKIEFPKKAAKIHRDKAKIHEIITNTREVLAYVTASDGDINSVCTMCMHFATSFASYKARFGQTVQTMIKTIFFDEQLNDKAKKALQSMEYLLYTLINLDRYMYSDKSCRAQEIQACSDASYNRASETVAKERANPPQAHETPIGCSACKSLVRYFKPILEKPDVRKDFINHAYQTLSKFFVLTKFDEAGIAIHPVIERIVNVTVNAIISDKERVCVMPDFCGERHFDV